MEEIQYFRDDERVFVIRPNPSIKPPFTLKRQSYNKDKDGNVAVNEYGVAKTTEHDVNDVVLMPGVVQFFTPPRRKDNNRLLTGLDVMVDNPYIDEPYYTSEWAEKLFKGKSKALLQHLLEYEHGVPFDHYTSLIPEGVIPSSDGTIKKYFQSAQRLYKLGNGIAYLYMSNPYDKLVYYALTARNSSITPTVAKNYEELSDGNLKCRWYFVDENKKREMEASKFKSKNKIIAAIEAIDNDPDKDASVKMLKALGYDEGKDHSITSERAYVVFNDKVINDPVFPELFLEHYDMWKNPATKKEIEAYAEIFDFVLYDLVRLKNNKYEVLVKGKKGASEVKLFASKVKFAREFILDPAFKEEVEEMRNSLKAARL